jgi:hypothetical protein
MNDIFIIGIVKRIPPSIRKIILEEQFIDKAINLPEPGTAMEYLFDVYEEFLDPSGEHDDYNCWKCRDHVLQEWRRMKPFIQQIQNSQL